MEDKFSLWNWKKSELGLVLGVMLFILAISWYQVKLGEMKTRDAQRKADVELVARGLWKYAADYGVLPQMATAEGKIISCGDKGARVCEWGSDQLVDVENVVYINKLPGDPLTSKGYKYVYVVNPDLKGFRIYVALENKGDKDYKKNLTIKCGDNVQCNWYVE